MDGRRRVLTALDHREPDRVPRDLAGTRYSSIHAEAYRRLRPALGLPDVDVQVVDVSQGLAGVHDDVLERFRSDVALVSSAPPSTYRRVVSDDGGFERFVDEWGVERARPHGGLYFESSSAPLGGDISTSDIEDFDWPDPHDPARFEGMAERARRICEQEGRAVVVGSICAGVSEMLFRLRGYEDGYMDLAADPRRAAVIMGRVMEVKLGYWERVLDEIGDSVDIVAEADDLGAQHAPLFSPATYRELVKPLHAEIIRTVKSRTDARFFLHSCGAIRELVPDLIEIGVDILNPVQVSAANMDTADLKAEFGDDIVFWGGAVDPQKTLARGTPDEVYEETSRRIGDLKPDGGFVFASVHNIQAQVPPENILAMWRALDEAGDYA